jgi:hypothetical protein
VHNPNSNLKLASGYKFKYNELRDAGANVCLAGRLRIIQQPGHDRQHESRGIAPKCMEE